MLPNINNSKSSSPSQIPISLYSSLIIISVVIVGRRRNKMKKAYGVLTAEYFVGYVYSETTGKAKSFALNSRPL
jgi:hypothetical protein